MCVSVRVQSVCVCVCVFVCSVCVCVCELVFACSVCVCVCVVCSVCVCELVFACSVCVCGVCVCDVSVRVQCVCVCVACVFTLLTLYTMPPVVVKLAVSSAPLTMILPEDLIKDPSPSVLPWTKPDQLSFSVIGFKFYRFCRFYRITRELKNSKMLPPLGSEPRHKSCLLPLS